MSEARLVWIGGPVLRARSGDVFRVGEKIEVGAARLPGEVIRLKGDELVAQVYEDTTGLKPGDVVRGSGRALSVRLGPGLLGRIFDGLLRPLDETPVAAQLAFRPLVEAGAEIAAGGAFGEIDGGAVPQRCLLPPDVAGTVETIAAAGAYVADAALCTLRGPDGKRREVGFFHSWPVREARPIAARQPSDEPMITGQRILDTLFPVARGGRPASPAASAPARPCCRRHWPNGATPMSSSMSAAASAATRWPRCCTNFPRLSIRAAAAG